MAFALAAGAGVAGVAVGAAAIGAGVLWAGSRIGQAFYNRDRHSSKDRELALFAQVFFFAAILAPFCSSSSNNSYRAQKQHHSRIKLWPF